MMNTTYQSWIDRIDNLITILRDLGYWDTVRVNLTMKELIELKLIITTCKELAEKEGRKYEDYFK